MHAAGVNHLLAMTPEEFHSWLDYIRYYEQPLLDFYYNHYFILVTIIVGIFMVIFLTFYLRAVRKADKEADEDKKKMDELAKTAVPRGIATRYYYHVNIIYILAGKFVENGSKVDGGRGRATKGVKINTLKKVTLPPHPLLASEFKGHTGLISDIDFDINAKYIASCSNG